MKRYILFVLVLFIIPTIFAITGESINGKFSELPTDVSVFVQPTIPIIDIFTPENTTYYSQNFLLNYSIHNNFTNAWYNIDNGPYVPLTTSPEATLSLTSSYGTHSLSLHANNSYGESLNQIYFTLTDNNPPEENTGGNGGGGSGGGGGAPQGFTLDKNTIENSLIPGETKTEKIKITNQESFPMEISIEYYDVKGFVLIKEENFKLNAKETKEIEINLFSSQDSSSGVKFGKIIFKTGVIKREINLILDVKQRQPLFDLNVEVFPINKEIAPGKKISAMINMTNVGLNGTAVDVDLILSIVNFDKNETYVASKNVIAVKTKESIIRSLQLPKRMPEGTYILLGEIKYNGITASSYDTFEVKGSYNSGFTDLVDQIATNRLILVLMIVSLLLIITLIIILIIQVLKKNKKIKK